jgi:hypothetical protein
MGEIVLRAWCHGEVEEVRLCRNELDKLECLGRSTASFCEAFRPLRALPPAGNREPADVTLYGHSGLDVDGQLKPNR